MASKNYLLMGFNISDGANFTLVSDMDQDKRDETKIMTQQNIQLDTGVKKSNSLTPVGLTTDKTLGQNPLIYR